jgi:peptide/nickel transport system permease protein
MYKLIAQKLLIGLLTLVLVIFTITSLIYLAPVDPARLTFGQRSDNATIEQKKKNLGLDNPLYIQMLQYINDISPISIHQDDISKYQSMFCIPIGKAKLLIKKPYLRESFQSGRKVSEILWDAIPQTAILALFAILIAIFIGIILGIITALRPGSFLDEFCIAISVLGYSLPSFIIAMVIALIFGYWLHAYTGLNLQGSLMELNDIGDYQLNFKNVILPAIALGIRPVALIMQMTRSSMLDVLNQDYIRTARAKGLSNYSINVKHALKNALNPIITAVSGWFASLLAGTFFVENVFGYNGLGQVTVNALLNFDIPIILASVIFSSIVFIILNIVVDILYLIVDPRIRIA